MELSVVILVGILMATAAAVFLIIRLSPKTRVAENLIWFALVCVVLSAVATFVTSWLSGKPAHVLKLSAPVTVLVVALMARRRRKRARESN